jgi:bacterioferritin
VINVGDSPQEQIENSLVMEKKGAETYNEGVRLSSELKDSASRELMERMVVVCEESVDWAEAQLDLIKMMGIENYLAQQVDKAAG